MDGSPSSRGKKKHFQKKNWWVVKLLRKQRRVYGKNLVGGYRIRPETNFRSQISWFRIAMIIDWSRNAINIDRSLGSLWHNDLVPSHRSQKKDKRVQNSDSKGPEHCQERSGRLPIRSRTQPVAVFTGCVLDSFGTVSDPFVAIRDPFSTKIERVRNSASKNWRYSGP